MKQWLSLKMKKPLVASAVAGLSLYVSSPYAELAQSPLVQSNTVKPNIMFLMDDSGSMDWEVISQHREEPRTYLSYGKNNGGEDYGAPYSAQHMKYHCKEYNKLAYDKDKIYTPWVGVDSEGNAFADQDPAAARYDPYLPSSASYPNWKGQTLTNTVDLVSNKFFYMQWSDKDGDGEYVYKQYADDECGETLSSTVSNNVHQACFDGEIDGCVSIANESEAQQKNFANWFTYYRKREYVAKAAMGQVIQDLNERVGLAMINPSPNGGVPVKDVDTESLPVDSTAVANKAALLDTLYKFDTYSDPDTPLRKALDRTGKYLMGNSDDASDIRDLFGLSSSDAVPGSPILDDISAGVCRKNFAVLMSDGYWNGGKPSGILNDDADGSSDYDGGSHADESWTTLADVAMYYYERDLAPTLANDLAASADDPNPAQHLVTYTVGFGVEGSLTENPTSRTEAFSWPNAYASDKYKVDDMRHAAWNGRGLFLSAYDAEELSDALKAALSDVTKKSGSAISLAASSSRLITGTYLYRAEYETGSWKGNLKAYPLSGTTGAVQSAEWEAADRIPAQDFRSIYTYNTNDKIGVAFKWNDIGPDLQGKLNTLNGQTDISKGQERLNYLSGDRSKEGTDFRTRESLMGDIVNSAPVYSGSGNFYYYNLESASYYDYLSDDTVNTDTNKVGRQAMVYVGANDGMLHAIRATGSTSCGVQETDCPGAEVFAYIPKGVQSNLSELTDPEYSHRYYVDGPLRVGDAYIDYKDSGSSGESLRWGSVLVGTLGAGGKGIFALDVSNPLKFSEKDVLWDLDSTDLTDLGYTLGRPAVVKMEDDTWAAVFSNGYKSGSGKAGLYIVNLENLSGSGIPTFKFIDTGVGGSDSPNGLSTPLVVDLDGNNKADAAFAGDLQGNLWKFDLSHETNRQQWKATKVFETCDSNASSCVPQPITAQPEYVKASSMILFGTGKYNELSDLSNNQVQTVYGIKNTGSEVARADLQEQQILSEVPYSSASDDVVAGTYRLTSQNDVDYDSKSGWYMDLYVQPESGSSANYEGERVVTRVNVRNGVAFFNTLIPTQSSCGTGGTGWFMFVDAKTGARTTSPVLDITGDSDITTDDQITVGGGQQSVSGKSSGGIVGGSTYIQGASDLHIYGSTASGGDSSEDTGEDTGIIKNTADGGDAYGRQSWIQLK